MNDEETKAWRKLEKRVAQAYRDMGARKVEHDVELGGRQIDVYVEFEASDRGVRRIAVEVKNEASPVGGPTVQDFSNVVAALRRERIVDEGTIVSASGFSRPGRNAAETYDIRLVTPDDLDAMRREAEKERRRGPAPYTPTAPPDLDTLADPGPLPPGHRMPFARNELFTGREGALKRLARGLLHKDGQSTLVTQAVAGMGGVGKTQLAVEFAYRYGRFFHGVHWLNARETAGMGAEVAACGEAMCLPGWPKELPEQVARTLDAWKRGGRRLVVLDNLEEVDAAREWLGRLSGGGVRVLVTARRSRWPRDLGLKRLGLEVFRREESRAFLREYVPQARATEGEVDELAGRLGHLPLALELAGRYLDGYPTLSVGAYVSEFESVLAHPSMGGWGGEMGSPTEHDLSMMATFELSWGRVEKEDARRVFLMAGYCAPNQPIPREVLMQASGLDKDACGRAVHVLGGLGLLKASEAGPMVHPLLGEYARAVAAAKGEGEEAEVLEAVAGAVAELASAANRSGLPGQFAPLRPHVGVVVRAAEDETLESAGRLWNSLGWHLDDVADYAGARGAYERALAIDEQAFGPEHPKVATGVNNLGLVLQHLGDLAGARACLERALAIDEQALGPEHPNVARDVNNLGGVHYALGEYEEARQTLTRALALRERVLGPEHPEVADTLNNLALMFRKMGKLEESRQMHTRPASGPSWTPPPAASKTNLYKPADGLLASGASAWK